MYQISDEQIDFILSDISARGVKMEDLQQSILDHICCIIEQNLEANGDFKDFYLRTVTKFYKKELSEIEEETILLLTFKNYYVMKKVMIGSGTAASIALISGSILKLFHLPGAAVLLVLGMLGMCFLFLPLLLISKVKEVRATRDKLILASGVLIGCLYCLSTLFKLQHWPGANILFVISLVLAFFIFIPAYFFTGIRNPETKVNTIVSTILMIAVTTMQFSLLNLWGKPKPVTKDVAKTSTIKEQTGKVSTTLHSLD